MHRNVRHVVFICATWLTCMCDMTHWVMRMCDMTRWVMHMCDMTRWVMSHIQVSHIAHMNTTRHVAQTSLSRTRIWIRHVAHCGSCQVLMHVKWVMSHIQICEWVASSTREWVTWSLREWVTSLTLLSNVRHVVFIRAFVADLFVLHDWVTSLTLHSNVSQIPTTLSSAHNNGCTTGSNAVGAGG